MEATGYYHYCLAQYLDKRDIKVSVVNPLSVKRFIQMKLSKLKQINPMQKPSVNMVYIMKFHYTLP